MLSHGEINGLNKIIKSNYIYIYLGVYLDKKNIHFTGLS